MVQKSRRTLSRCSIHATCRSRTPPWLPERRNVPCGAAGISFPAAPRIPACPSTDSSSRCLPEFPPYRGGAAAQCVSCPHLCRKAAPASAARMPSSVRCVRLRYARPYTRKKCSVSNCPHWWKKGSGVSIFSIPHQNNIRCQAPGIKAPRHR